MTERDSIEQLPDGWYAPVHRSLYEPVLIAGTRPQIIAALIYAVFTAALVTGFQPVAMTVTLVAVVVAFVVSVRLLDLDPWALEVFQRSRNYADYHPAHPHPDAPPAVPRTVRGKTFH